jgi:hypothetical protein
VSSPSSVVGFGGCPVCRKSGHYLNVFKDIWFVCDEHKKRWSGGYGLFSSWQNETEDDWERNEKLLMTYDECKPFYPELGDPSLDDELAAKLESRNLEDAMEGVDFDSVD